MLSALHRNQELLTTLKTSKNISNSVFDVLDVFLWLSETPRRSGDLEAIRQKIIQEVLKYENHRCLVDRTGNLLIRVPASPGLENKPLLAFQAHLDMVLSKNNDVEFDFATEAIKIIEKDGYLKAEGTTLGADNGIGVAAALALIFKEKVAHGPLEFLFTVDEETTLGGAKNLGVTTEDVKEAYQIYDGELNAVRVNEGVTIDAFHGEPVLFSDTFLSSPILINLDSEEAESICIGCAGSWEAVLEPPTEYVDFEGQYIELTVSGLRGGHTGVDVHEERANAHKLLVRSLLAIDAPFKLISWSGGTAANSIPREAVVQFVIDDEKIIADGYNVLLNKLSAELENIKLDYQKTDPNIIYELKVATDGRLKCLTSEKSEQIFELLVKIQSGPVRWSPNVKGLVDTSISLSNVYISQFPKITQTSPEPTSSKIILLARSMNPRHAAAYQREMAYLCRQMNYKLEGAFYPPWEPKPNSPAVEMVKAAMQKALNGKEAHTYAIHAGLECALFLAKYPNLDCASFGPTIENAHSPDERLKIDTVGPFYETVLNLIQM